MEIKARPSTVLLFGCGLLIGFAALVLLVSGRDLSPSKTVASSEHSVVAPMANAETAWKSNSRHSPGPEQIIVVQVEGYGGSREAQSQAAIELSQADSADTSGSTGWRTPNPPTEETGDSTNPHPNTATASSEDILHFEDGSSLSTSEVGKGAGRPSCDELAQRIHDSHDYRGTADERACFGEEDDPRVGLALDYGKTEAGYAASEQTLKPGSYGCMLEADGIVANGWQGTAEQVECFGYDDLAGINEAYGALEEGRTSY